MVNVKKIVRLLTLISLLVLAGIGIGMCGGVPLPKSTNRRDTEKEQTELVEPIEAPSDIKANQN